MIIYPRKLNLLELLNKKSFFLLGPRATGKTFLIKTQLQDIAIIINLLKTEYFLRLSEQPWLLESIIQSKINNLTNPIIVIDEIQKIPLLLNEVHRLIEEKKWRFLLTGSSARKLKHGHANLLAGRAWTAHFYCLSAAEIPNFDLERYLRYGGLPAVYASEHPEEELDAYAYTYLYEEIQAEGLVRKLAQFSRFLKFAAIQSGALLNFAKISSDTGIAASTIREYYAMLEETLLGFTLNPWSFSKKRKAITTAKFYLFDCGVTHTLAGTKVLDRNSDLYGRSFEQWIALELKNYIDFKRLKEPLGFWQSQSHLEVDFTIGEQIAIETKATIKVNQNDLKGLLALQSEDIFKTYYLISHDPIEKITQNIHCMNWKNFVLNLWDGKLF